MSAIYQKKVALGLAVFLAVTAIGAQYTLAQGRTPRSPIERRQHPEAGFWTNQRASRNIQHARDYSRSIGQYTAQAAIIDPAITKVESQTLGHQLQGIQREMAVIRKENASNPQAVEQVKGIETKLTQAIEHQKMLHTECCKDTPDGHTCSEMAAKVTLALDQIAKDHAKLMKALGYADAEVAAEHATTEVPEAAKGK